MSGKLAARTLTEEGIKSLSKTESLLKTEVFFYATAFAFALLVRAYVASFSPWPTEGDGPIYVASSRINAQLLLQWKVSYPLSSEIFAVLYLLGLDMVTLFKIYPVVMHGLSSTAVLFFCRHAMRWQKSTSLVAALLYATSISTLRISLDLFNLLLGIPIMILSLAYLSAEPKRYGQIPSLIIGLTAALMHAMVALVVLCVFFSFTILKPTSLTLKRRIAIALSYGAIISSVVVAIMLFGVIGYKNLASLAFERVEPNDGRSWLLQFLLLYGIGLPVIVFGFMKNRVLNLTTLVLAVGSFGWVFLGYGLSLPARWMLLLSFPFSIYASVGLRRLWQVGPWHFSQAIRFSVPRTLALGMVIMMLLPTISTIGIVAPFPPFDGSGQIQFVTSFRDASNLPPQYMAPLKESLLWLEESADPNGAVIARYGDFANWAIYYTNLQIVYDYTRYYPTLSQLIGTVLDQALSISADVYAVGFHEPSVLDMNFKLIFISNTTNPRQVAIYKYDNPLSRISRTLTVSNCDSIPNWTAYNAKPGATVSVAADATDKVEGNASIRTDNVGAGSYWTALSYSTNVDFSSAAYMMLWVKTSAVILLNDYVVIRITDSSGKYLEWHVGDKVSSTWGQLILPINTSLSPTGTKPLFSSISSIELLYIQSSDQSFSFWVDNVRAAWTS